ncbi:MAG: glycosyltransferase [Acidobacteriota bacterium]
MHIVTGPHIPAEQLQRLQQRVLAHPHITVQHYATDFLSWLQRADVSISLAGYNTCMDILSAGVRALVYPFTGQNNDEQTRRARKLSEAGLIRMLEPESCRQHCWRHGLNRF